jgi:dienelactone hydrolase
MHHCARPLVLITLCVAATVSASADSPRALPPGQRPHDSRLGPLRTLDDYFPFTPVASKDAWTARASDVRRRILVSQGLWPMPSRTPLEAVVHGKVERDDFTVERVFFQSYPGHFVTGSLFRPKGGDASAKHPAVLCPHGHWNNGRFYDAGEAELKKQIAKDAEKFDPAGRYPLQARCVQLARMGCVVFHYDMIGNADSIQFADHRPGVREAMNTTENWGFFSPQAELHLQNMMGLQTWNSVRALDFVLSLPDVDPARVAVTGASGGGTQTMLITAVDNRVKLAFPAVMVSTAMQGGCTCENAPYLRIDQGNIDIAALAAPRPLGMTAADDWTKELMTKGYPDLQKLYALLDVPDRVFAAAFTQFEHNYNYVSRSQMYAFVNKQLKLGLSDAAVVERDFKPLTKEELTVWTGDYPKPTGDAVGDAQERKLLKWLTQDAEKHITEVTPKDAASLNEFRRVVGGAWDTIIGRRLENVTGPIDYALSDKADKGTYLQMTSTITLKERNEQLPMLFLHPKDKEKWNGQVVLWLTDTGKSGLLDANGAPPDAIVKLLNAGYAVAGIDLFMQGEFLEDPSKPLTDVAIKGYGNGKEAWQKAACYTFGYNPPLFARRVHDVLTAIKFMQGSEHETKQIHLVGLGIESGPIAAAARAEVGEAVTKCAVDTGGFRFASLDRFSHPMFVPGAVKYGDLQALLAMNAPHKLWIAGEGDAVPTLVKGAYSGAACAATAGSGAADGAVAWLLK